MGNTAGKKQCDSACQKNLDTLYYTISNNKTHILRGDLKKSWGSEINRQLYSNIENYLFTTNYYELSSQTFKKFYVDVCKGDVEKRADFVMKVLGAKEDLSGPLLLQFVKSLISSMLPVLENKVPKRFHTWNSRVSQIEVSETLEVYTIHFFNQIFKEKDDRLSKQDLCDILRYLDSFFTAVFCRLYDTEEKHYYSQFLPKWKSVPADSGKILEEISVMDMLRIIFLNSYLPMDLKNEWRIFFSTKIHGESFSKLVAEIVRKGPTLIIVKDKDGHVFGGFAPFSWTVGPSFYGDSRSFLFTLYPKMVVFNSSGYNGNYQYLNINQQTMPNGLGMGGKLDYFGLWISANFGKGSCSETCTTYRNYKMMSGNKEFEVEHLEVWGVGSLTPSLMETGEKSSLDSNPEAKAILEMAGKGSVSDGLREN